MKIEIHVLQNFAPSCLNRDDTNTPKTCEFGGALRARVSSQSWKKAVRDYFREEHIVPTGLRTRLLLGQLKEKLAGQVPDDKIAKFLEDHYSKFDKDDKARSAVLLFISDQEIDAIAHCLINGLDKKVAAGKLAAAGKSVDLALFGRMLAENKGMRIDGACQVAHALSTHRVNMETDYFTAVDDLAKGTEENTGAGMVGIQGYNSACLYRYAMVDVKQLSKNLQGDAQLTLAAVEAFIRAFCLVIPSAKQNSMAAQNLPSLVLLVARDRGVPVSLANAFAKPVVAEDIISTSVKRLADYFGQINKVYNLYDGATIALAHDRENAVVLGDLGAHAKDSFNDAVATVMANVRGGRE